MVRDLILNNQESNVSINFKLDVFNRKLSAARKVEKRRGQRRKKRGPQRPIYHLHKI